MKLKFLFFLVLLFFVSFTYAQTCTGSVGDPIVKVTFGAGSSFGPPLPANTISSLNYATSTCPPDGNYSILNYTSGCFGNDVVWHTTRDHTGDSEGYFMLINASYVPSDFYIQTIPDLCSGTTYRFAAWMLNLCSVKGILPNITLTIEKTDGSVLATYQTGDVPIVNPATWKEYGFNFTLPAGITTVVLRMKNNAPGGVGNDVGLDDITFRPIGPSVIAKLTAFDKDTISICTQDNMDILIKATVENCYISTAYQWQHSTNGGLDWTDISGENAAEFIRRPTQAGIFEYRLAVAEQGNISSKKCRVVSNPVVIKVYANDSRTIKISTSSSTVCENDPVAFSAGITEGGDSPIYQWFVNDQLVGANSAQYTLENPSTGDVVNCLFTSSLPCNKPIMSDRITITVNKVKSLIIQQNICEGKSYEGYSAQGQYVDVFKGSNGCDSTRTLNLTVYPRKLTTLDTTICYGSNYEGFSQSGTYTKQFFTQNGCDSMVTIVLKVLPDLYLNLISDTVLCEDDSIILDPGNFDSYVWQDGSVNQNFTAIKGGNYSVKVSNKCCNVVKKFLVQENSCMVLFPNAFTPNQDGVNDVFRILNNYHLTNFHLEIYDRWGKKIFSSFDPAKGWEGTFNGVKASPGDYVWICTYSRNGLPVKKLKGTVVLLQ